MRALQGLRTDAAQTPQHLALLTGLPLGPSSPGGPLGPGGPAAPEGPASPFSPLSPLGPWRGRQLSSQSPLCVHQSLKGASLERAIHGLIAASRQQPLPSVPVLQDGDGTALASNST